jgi:hypothetical protein
MDTDFLDEEARQLVKGHEHSMPCRRAIGLMLVHVKERVAENAFTSQEEALSHFRHCVRDLPQCKKHKLVKKTASRRRKSGTKLRYK